MPLDDFLAHREPNARAFVLIARVQALKNDENTIVILGVDTDAVVVHRKLPESPLSIDVDVNPGCIGATKLQGVADQIGEQLFDVPRVCQYARQRIVCDDRVRR